MAHVEAVPTLEEYKANIQHGTTITRSLDKIGENVTNENRHYVKTIAEIILLCARHEIALRGHDETRESLNPGNFRSLLTFIGNHDQIVGKRIKEDPQNAKYTSPEIQNELLGVMGDMVLQTISNEVQRRYLLVARR
ncbi:Zinc finger MYM-type protein 1-like [Oopsacas minuta]|uniref:Zinc finger MYM-type protein 1-like n=1 Tax=Oopsacas minuta TaxID=111878 RepID=A0AAV7K6E6_9METZ|nr:Zinc finger MYM-type protein 1-like [Oopsacas minuta]